eukprot:TRINITY_DN13250_c0_g1_i1.p4 TRINITY_DN13250_c0_g1~~TRINITY_DN13250_c0_g1_i1.p4  ORF type:complete len:106 (-),score=16.90 TRINITY_DN13250_c0_g1_i1:142-459(-)
MASSTQSTKKETQQAKKYQNDQAIIQQIKRPQKKKHRSVKLVKLPSIEEQLHEVKPEVSSNNLKSFSISTKEQSIAFSSGQDAQLNKQLTPKFHEQTVKQMENEF